MCDAEYRPTFYAQYSFFGKRYFFPAFPPAAGLSRSDYRAFFSRCASLRYNRSSVSGNDDSEADLRSLALRGVALSLARCRAVPTGAEQMRFCMGEEEEGDRWVAHKSFP